MRKWLSKPASFASLSVGVTKSGVGFKPKGVKPPAFLEIVLRGAKSSCPKCGQGKLYEGWNHLKETCEACGLVLRAREDGTWFFMYMSSAGITGIFLIGLFLITPSNLVLGQVIVAILAVLTFVLTSNARKGVAIGLDYWVDRRSRFPRFPV